jgi:RNA polymerase sigma-70 factor (ECF subfamily)
LDDVAADTIRRKARQLIGKAGFSKSDEEDIRQELTLRLFRQRQRFKPKESSWPSFVKMVIERQAANLLRHQRAEKRDHRFTRSLCSRLNGSNGTATDLDQTLSQREYNARRRRSPRDELDLAQLTTDVTAWVSGLPPDLQDLAQRLRTQTVSEISRETKVPRTTIYSKLRLLRRLSESAGLRMYLE